MDACDNIIWNRDAREHRSITVAACIRLMGVSLAVLAAAAWLGHHVDPTFRWQRLPVVLVFPAGFCWLLLRDGLPLRITTTLDASGIRHMAVRCAQGPSPRIIRNYELPWDVIGWWRLRVVENGAQERYQIAFGTRLLLSFRPHHPAIFQVDAPTQEAADAACRFIASHAPVARRRSDQRQLSTADRRLRILMLLGLAWFTLLAIPAIRDHLFPLAVLLGLPSDDTQPWRIGAVLLLTLSVGPGIPWLLAVCPRRVRNGETAIFAIVANVLTNYAGALVLPVVIRVYAFVVPM